MTVGDGSSYDFAPKSDQIDIICHVLMPIIQAGRGAAQSSKCGSPREQGVRLACRRKELPKKRKLLLRREEKAHFEAHFFALDVIVCVIAGENAHKIHFLREIKIDRRDIA